ncbi:MAG: glutathione S-transferase family protein, partial [Deltaproteobacteria bacterium]|nr:glutathione S-transferase family protein [Deltaproteobacteria bacterium]
AELHRIFGAENSPYSVKVRSYFRYKGIPHEWIVRSAATQAEFLEHAKLPLIPLVVTPEGESIQDSTPILEAIEARFPEPSIHPDDPALAFVSALVEEFGDEWGNKWMFHYRWAREADQIACAGRLADEMAPGLPAEQRAQTVAAIRERMVGRVWFVGSSPETAPRIESGFQEAVALLEKHLATRPYLFGGRPAFGDFGLFAQIYEADLDPTPSAILHERAPRVLAWVKRMLEPKAEGGFESWSALAPTLEPLLKTQVGALFLPWSDANARAIAAGEETFTTDLAGAAWTQKPQKYHARSLGALRKRYAELADRSALDPILERTACKRWL